MHFATSYKKYLQRAIANGILMYTVIQSTKGYFLKIVCSFRKYKHKRKPTLEAIVGARFFQKQRINLNS